MYKIEIYGINILLLSLAAGLIPATIVYFTSPRRHMPSYNIMFAIVGFVLACVWIYHICNIIMDLMQLIGMLSGLDPLYLGLTFLAWGNSLGGTPFILLIM